MAAEIRKHAGTCNTETDAKEKCMHTQASLWVTDGRYQLHFHIFLFSSEQERFASAGRCLLGRVAAFPDHTRSASPRLRSVQMRQEVV